MKKSKILLDNLAYMRSLNKKAPLVQYIIVLSYDLTH